MQILNQVNPCGSAAPLGEQIVVIFDLLKNQIKLRENLRSVIKDKVRETVMRLKTLSYNLVLLRILVSILNGEHLVSEREKEKHTPLIFLERQKCPKLFTPSGENADPRWTS